jgi:hypothetical protein
MKKLVVVFCDFGNAPKTTQVKKQNNRWTNISKIKTVEYSLLGISPASEFRRRGNSQKIIFYNYNTAKV